MQSQLHISMNIIKLNRVDNSQEYTYVVNLLLRLSQIQFLRIQKNKQRAMFSDIGLFGLFSGIATTSLLQPFQNIKMALMIPPKDLKLGHNFIINLFNSARYIYQLDKLAGFYKGFWAANIKSGLGCYIFFTILRFRGKQEDLKPYQDFLLSSTARIISCFLTNPFNIIETRYQLAGFHQYTSIKGAIVDIYRKEGAMGFFSGAIASCWKEGFFAGLYYMMYQQMKERGVNKLAAGVISGMIATSITHPIQIVRAKIQTRGLIKAHVAGEHLIVKQLKRMVNQGGWFKGLTPRILKKPVANTMTFYIFELIEQIKSKDGLIKP